MQQAVSEYFEKRLGVCGKFAVNERKKQLSLNFAAKDQLEALKKSLALDGWACQTEITSHAIKPGLKKHPEIKNVIAIASGKGGVGKSTTTINLAYALKAAGARVGILDADIYGPSQPLMLGLQGAHPEDDGSSSDSKIPPLVDNDIQSMSIGYLLAGDDTPMIWRGPMATRALSQLFFDTDWKSLDYLLVDLPPGTGDIPLSLVQKIPLTAAVIVTTPQDIALIDAKKALQMFNKVGVPVLGVVENMSYHICPTCGHKDTLFGEHGGKALSTKYQLALLGEVPLEKQIRERSDSGNVGHLLDEAPAIGDIFKQIAMRVSAYLSLQKKDYSGVFGDVVVQDS